jgi:hypothetical protein
MLPILFGYLFEYVTRAVKLLANVHPGVAKMVTAGGTKVNPIRLPTAEPVPMPYRK